MADIEQATYRQRLDKLSLPELAVLSEKLWGEVDTLARRTVEKTWELGGVVTRGKRPGGSRGLDALAGRPANLPRHSKTFDAAPFILSPNSAICTI